MVDNRLKDDDLPPTFDSEEQRKRIAARKAKMLENEIVQSGPNSGPIPSADMEAEYSVAEPKRKRKVGKKAPTPVIDE